MTRRSLPDLTLIALIVSCFTQIGAQLFAIAVVARVVQSAPPRSFAILEGPYRYDSSAFWNVVPLVTTALFVIAIVGNWKTDRRKLIVGAFTLFIIAGVIAGVYLEPMFAKLVAVGYRDSIDPGLQARAATWYAMDCAVWVLGLIAGIALLFALASQPRRNSDPN